MISQYETTSNRMFGQLEALFDIVQESIPTHCTKVLAQ